MVTNERNHGKTTTLLWVHWVVFVHALFIYETQSSSKENKRNKWHKLSGNCSAKGTSSNLALGMCPLIFYIHHIKDIYKTERVSGILPFFKIVIKYHLTIIPQLKLFFTLLVPLNETHYFIWGEKYSTSKSLIAISSGTDQFSVDVPGTRIMQIMTHSRCSFGIYKSKIVN